MLEFEYNTLLFKFDSKQMDEGSSKQLNKELFALNEAYSKFGTQKGFPFVKMCQIDMN